MEKVALNFESNETLSDAYMPFVEAGGLLIMTDEPFALGTDIEVTLTLPEGTTYPVFETKVIWHASKHTAKEDHQPGYGIQISGKQAQAIRAQIEELLAP